MINLDKLTFVSMPCLLLEQKVKQQHFLFRFATKSDGIVLMENVKKKYGSISANLASFSLSGLVCAA